jgi:hypothetical protein
MHHAGHDLALAAGVLAVDHVTLGLAQALAVDLPGGLRCDAAQLGLRHVLRNTDLAADPGRRVDLLRVGDQHLQLRILDLFGRGDHVVFAEDADLAGLGVNLDDHVLRRLGVPTVGRLDGLLQRLDQDLLGDTLFRIQLQQSTDEVPAHHRTSALLGEKQTWVGEPTHVTTQHVSIRLQHGRRNRSEVYQPKPILANAGLTDAAAAGGGRTLLA